MVILYIISRCPTQLTFFFRFAPVDTLERQRTGVES